MNIGMFATLATILFLVSIVFQQSRKIKTLREENEKALSNEYNDELIALTEEKLKAVGVIKTVKFLREEKGMSMVDAKRFVDTVKGN